MHTKAFGDRAMHGPRGGAYSAPSDPLAGFKGATLRRGKQGRTEGRKGTKGGIIPLPTIPGSATDVDQRSLTGKGEIPDLRENCDYRMMGKS